MDFSAAGRVYRDMTSPIHRLEARDYNVTNHHRLFGQTMTLCKQEQIRTIQIRLGNFTLVGKRMISRMNQPEGFIFI